MPTDERDIERATQLADLLEQDDGTWRTVRHDSWRFSWFGNFLGVIVPLVGAAAIEYVSTKLSPTEEDFDATVLVFTTDALIAVTKTGQVIEAAVIARSNLTRVKATGSASVFSDNDSRWPGRYRVELSYSSGETYELPVGVIHTAQLSSRLMAFAPSLVEDLSR